MGFQTKKKLASTDDIFYYEVHIWRIEVVKLWYFNNIVFIWEQILFSVYYYI